MSRSRLGPSSVLLNNFDAHPASGHSLTRQRGEELSCSRIVFANRSKNIDRALQRRKRTLARKNKLMSCLHIIFGVSAISQLERHYIFMCSTRFGEFAAHEFHF